MTSRGRIVGIGAPSQARQSRRVEIDGKRLDVTIPRGADTGTRVKVSGQGFGAGETVVISFHTTEVGRTTANGAGSFSGVEITVPEEFGVFAPSQFFVIAHGESTIKSARAPFTVSG